MKNNACVRLTQKTAKALIQRELNLSASRLKKERAEGGVYIYKMTLGRFEITVENDWFERNGLYVLEISSGTGEAMRLYYDPDTLEENCEAEDKNRAEIRKGTLRRVRAYAGRTGGHAMKRRRPRRRSPLPFLLLAVAVVGCAFAVAVAAVVPMEADSPGGQDQALPAPTLEEAERDKLEAPAAATLTPTPAPYIPDETEVEMLARLIWGEARGIPSDMHKAAVVWCVLNRVDAEGWPDTVAETVTQPHQFAGYSPDYPATEEFKAIAADVLIRWEREKREGGEVGRVLPAEYVFFTGDGEVNHFRTEYEGGMFWDWSLKNPYSS